MVGKAQKVRLGIFITLLSLLLFTAIAFIAGGKLMEKWDFYHITFSDVSVNGLQVGGQVRYHGIEVGKIDNIKISSEDVSQVQVTISVTQGTPIKTDVEARLVMVGITGLKVVELSGGSNEAPLLKPGSEIPPGTSVLDNITGKAEIMAEKLELIMNNILAITNTENQEKLTSILSSVDAILIENREPIGNTITNLDSTTAELTQLLHSTNQILLRFNDIIQKGEIDTMITNFTTISDEMAAVDIQQLAKNLNLTIAQINQTVKKIDLTVVRSQEDIISMIETLRDAVENLDDFARRISEDPTILLRRNN
ncbi:MAG: MlaD family protein [Candidatus Cloacimonetes bacterium]|nr:MlaD family protein [Candidatus Cloacimonadota bacterium]